MEFRRVLFGSNDTATTEIYTLALLPAGPREDALAIFTHARMPAEIASGVRGLESPLRDVLADEIVNASRLALPCGVFPGAAGGRNELEPGRFRRDLFQLFAVSEFPGTAPSLH